MATFKMATKNVLSQSGFDEPVIASNVDFSSATFPAGTVKYIDRIVLLNTSQPSTDSTSFVPTGLELLIPSATVALYSKIYFNFFHSLRWQSGAHATNRLIDMKLLCDGGTQDGDVLFNIGNQGYQAADMTSIRGDFGGSAVHTTLGTGDRTYKFQVRKGGGTSSYSGTIYYQGATGCYSTMIAFGVV